jgi:murein DD-endopeptidase MepM/ murein hydrolase activator NlpD
MLRAWWVALIGAGVLAGCTTFVPVSPEGGTTWQEAREAPYRPGVSRVAAAGAEPWHADGAAGASRSGAISLEPILPAQDRRESYDPRPLPPLQGQTAWEPQAAPARDEGWGIDERGYSVPPEPEPEPLVAAAPPPPDPPPAVRAEPASAPPPRPQAAPEGVAQAARGSTDLAPPALSNVGFLWPAEGEVLDGGSAGAPGHIANGLAIKGRSGAPFVAAENGVVVYAGDSTTAYGHAERLDVAVGDVVRRGQRLGIVGSTGAVEDPQLYFEMRVGSQVVDPRHYLMGSPQVASN